MSAVSSGGGTIIRPVSVRETRRIADTKSNHRFRGMWRTPYSQRNLTKQIQCHSLSRPEDDTGFAVEINNGLCKLYMFWQSTSSVRPVGSSWVAVLLCERSVTRSCMQFRWHEANGLGEVRYVQSVRFCLAQPADGTTQLYANRRLVAGRNGFATS